MNVIDASLKFDPKDLTPETRAFLDSPLRLIIDGKEVEASDGATLQSFDPATGAQIASVSHAGQADVDAAVASAEAALSGPWGNMPPAEREARIRRFADLIEENIEMIGQVESLDSGKPAEQIKAVDIALGIGALRYNAGWPTKLEAETLPVNAPDMHVYTRHEPLGVVAAITPWNFPLCQACFKIAPALAAGCTVILKPAEQTPLSAIILGRLALEADIPPGVLNVLPGLGTTTGQALVEHPGVHKIAFTGSEAVGKHIAATASSTLKHVSFELGGKNPNIIFADADIETAAATAAMAIFFYAGQVCSAGSRLMVEAPVFDKVAEIVTESAKGLKLGHGLNADTTMGPLISQEQFDRVSGYVKRAEADGVTIASGAAKPGGALEAGFFHEPTVLLDVADQLPVVCEEIFGPVLCVQRFTDVDEVVARANDTSFGLAAGVWTHDVRKSQAVAAKLQAGTVWVNTYNQFDAAAPWGGYKQSGYGRDNGREGILKFLQTKTVWSNYG
ncbi:aldehyde dehydrogenase family protein [Methyloligella sp. 2.7D]|uniref:aldehyde dehydrogenase family protein n=1 Tax=unclassified Methyloligella TaxID=2625955 RepID=UPI00157DE352|nr:aldehyde dehydrogenase family protein [Methyloligella sp. GL2]QKP76964.1 aldehyde dehydrogenase family protein [Methyloligella sp. GL2]